MSRPKEIRDNIHREFLDGLNTGDILAIKCGEVYAFPQYHDGDDYRLIEKYGSVWRYIGLGAPREPDRECIVPLWLEEPVPLIESAQKSGMVMTLDLHRFNAHKVYALVEATTWSGNESTLAS